LAIVQVYLVENWDVRTHHDWDLKEKDSFVRISGGKK
jgi:hypothetical protein